MVVRVLSPVSEESHKTLTNPTPTVIKEIWEHPPLNEEVLPYCTLAHSDHAPMEKGIPPPLPVPVKTLPKPMAPMAVFHPELTLISNPDPFALLMAAIQEGQRETRIKIAKLGEHISVVECGERIPKPTLQMKLSAPKLAPPVSILK